MAANCPYWRPNEVPPHGTCGAPYPEPSEANKHLCSWPDGNYRRCIVFRATAVKLAGGAASDLVQAGDDASPGVLIALARGNVPRRFSAREIEDIVSDHAKLISPQTVVTSAAGRGRRRSRVGWVPLGAVLAMVGVWLYFTAVNKSTVQQEESAASRDVLTRFNIEDGWLEGGGAVFFKMSDDYYRNRDRARRACAARCDETSFCSAFVIDKTQNICELFSSVTRKHPALASPTEFGVKIER